MWLRDTRTNRTTWIGGAAIAVVTLLTLAASARADDGFAPTPHVRGEAGMQRLVDEAARRSPAIQEWIDRLQVLDVVVYVRTRVFARMDLDGRVSLLSTANGVRYLVIELACGRPALVQMATLGHELFHAIEIAEEPSVVSADTLAAFYSRIGVKTGDGGGLRTFETEAAAAAGVHARRQLLISTRKGNGT